jgi:uncharacterized protein YceH (UPF0502 family)
MDAQESAPSEATVPTQPKPLNKLQRRILGVLIEKARTTPDAYPLSLSGLVAGVNQKSNRSPLMNLSPEQTEDELIQMRSLGLVAEVQGSGRVSRFRHFGYDYLGVKGVEAAVMTELLLRGEQSAGDLRVRASRFDPIPDLPAMNEILRSLMAKGLVIALTPPGRGQIFSHNLYQPEELTKLKNKFVGATGDSDDAADQNESEPTPARTNRGSELSVLQAELEDLRAMVSALQDRVTRLET